MISSLPAVHHQDPVLLHARKDFAVFRRNMTVQETLNNIRENGIGERIIYFYVVDEQNHLTGVLPTRRLLSAPLSSKLHQIMIDKVIAIPHTITVMDACEWFVMHRLLAFPVVDEQRRILGIVDVNLFTEELLDITEREQSDSIFETLGFRIAQVKNASPFRAFRFRFPWLLTTITGGILCALLVSFFELTLAQSLVLAFFLTLVLGLGESVSMQSMTVTIQSLHQAKPSLRWFRKAFGRELVTAILLGSTSGILVGLIAWFWRGTLDAAIVIGLGIMLSLIIACLLGVTIPALLHAIRLDPKIAAGPMTLALTDIFTLLFYFNLAVWIL
jgi:magnesium transporter